LGRGIPGVVVYESAEKERLLLAAFQGFRDELRHQQETIFDLACELDPTKRESPNKQRIVTEFLKTNPDKHPSDEACRRAAAGAYMNCRIISGVLKNSSFREEKEWRMVHAFMAEKSQEFRVAKRTLIPYKSFPWANVGVSIVDVILGPGSDENALLAARRLLKEGIDVEPRLPAYLQEGDLVLPSSCTAFVRIFRTGFNLCATFSCTSALRTEKTGRGRGLPDYG
jgi:hypothetical protein